MIDGLPVHHVGIVLPGEDDVATLMALLGMREDYRGFVPQWRALCIFAHSGVGPAVEFVVPDGGLYLRTYAAQAQGKPEPRFPFQDEEERDPLWTPIASVNRVFYQDRESLAGHRVIYDFALLAKLLTRSGFADAQQREYRRGADATLLVDTPERASESLYLEAVAD